MKIYLEDKALFVRGEEARFYKVESVEMWDGYSNMWVNLTPLCGMAADGSFYAPTEENAGEWEGVALCYYLVEGLRSALEANDFDILEELPEDARRFLEGE